MALHTPRFLTGRDTHNGLAGYLQRNFRAWGTATVASGDTSIDVTDTDIKAGDIIIASALTKGANAAYVVGTTITAGQKFNIAVNTDPGNGGVVLAFIILRPTP